MYEGRPLLIAILFHTTFRWTGFIVSFKVYQKKTKKNLNVYYKSYYEFII